MPSANDLGVIGRFEQREAHHRRTEAQVATRREIEQGFDEARHDQEEPEQHHDQRHGAEQVDVAGGEPRQRLDRRQTHHGQQGAPDDADDHRLSGDDQRNLHAVPQEGQSAGDGGPVEFVNHDLPPI
jgi:hypothetical protein